MERSLSSQAVRARAGEEGFRFRRLGFVAGLDIKESLGRPLFLIFWAIMALNGGCQSRGNWAFRSIDTSLGSPRSWVDSEFQTAYIYALIGYFIISFFVAVAAGMPLIRDTELKVGDLLHSTSLRPSEYVWGKFLAALAACFVALLVLPLSTGIFSHFLPDSGSPDIYGPFRLMAYVRPLMVFLVPAVIFTAGVAFALGRWTGRPILVFLFPVALYLLCQNYLWGTYPPKISEDLSLVLRYLDPSGFRWLKETWLFTDKGITFYNTQPMSFDAPFLLSRAAFALTGLLLVDLSRRHFSRRLRRPARVQQEETSRVAVGEEARLSPLAALGMKSRLAGFFEGTLAVARFELEELRSQPGLYIFIPFILLFLYILYRDMFGNFDTALSPLLLTPGTAATRGMTFLTGALGLLLLFYTVESLERERTREVAPLFYATPVPTGAVVAGKVLANAAVVGVALLGAFGVAALSLYGEGKVPIEIRPFLEVWGLLFLPTMIVWMTFVAAVLALTKSRFGTYGVCLGAALATVSFYLWNHMNWVGNWVLIGNTGQTTAMAWTDMGGFDIDRTALVLNRLFVLSLSVLFGWTAGRFLLRRDRDRLHPVLPPTERLRTLRTAGLLALPPLVLGLTLWGQVNQGFQGAAVEKEHKDYWRKNVQTWAAEPLPYVTHVEMDIDLEPATRGFQVSGFYDLQNQKDKPLYWIPVTGGTAWKGLSWTLDGRPQQPEDRSHLYVFRLAWPLVPGQSVRLGFKYRGTMLPGISKNGGDLPLGEFILPSGVILTGRNPDFVPKIGFDRKIGVDEKNFSEVRIYPPHFYEGRTDSDLDRSSFTQRLRITAPAEYTVTSTGILEGETVRDGRRTTVWVSDYPVRVFNVAAGRWTVKRGPGTAVFYHPGHPFNVESMLEALNGARRWYAVWYAPFPWRELRLNEFPAFAEYARGNATNIFFSEGVGFLTERKPGNDEAFAIAAHEAAHSWWGHIMSPGEGPGGIVLAEGGASFATLMLLEQMRGPLARQVQATHIEALYGEYRMPSDEKPLAGTVERDGRPGDVVVVYNKGAWALWMLRQQMGHDAFVAGVQQFFRTYHNNPDHPVIEDFVAVMRPYAPDKKGFDEVARQMFFETVTPEYRLEEPRKQAVGGGAWEVTVKVENAGTGRFPVEVAATRGQRFDDEGKVSAEYRDARAQVVLGAGESKLVRIRCPFEPQRVVVDPEAHVLQLQRRAATAKL